MGKRTIISMLVVFLPIIIYAQGAGGQIRRPIRQQTSTTPAKKRQTSRNNNEQKPTNKKKKELTETVAYNVTINCNVPSATLTIDGIRQQGTANGSRLLYSGIHTIGLSADGYAPLTQSIQVSSNSKSFSFTMKKKESSEADGFYVTINCNVPSASLFIDDKSSPTASGVFFLNKGPHTIKLNADGYEPLSQSIQVNPGSRSFNFVMKEKENHLPPVIVIQNLVNNMVRVEGGTFTMGATSEQGSDAYSDEKPTHQVKVSSFSIGKYEVTQEEWEAVMGSNPSDFKGAKRPVENVSWNDCQNFISKLNSMTGKHFRLPTEAEWEYAARGGNKSIGYKYAGSDNLDRVAWYDSNSGSMTHHVGQKSPNELGLYDMSGNVWEWCQDLKGSYNSNRQKNPTGPSSGSGLVGRGGSWISNARYCRVSYRFSKSYDYKFYSLGLRLAL